ncbi:extensin family protein [Bradyrhizobium sp. BRP22]|uniref:extensin family protein n=1 Tax=Bradyrhizobium sp. BRP22 TaxID=2793821 RepID=UPI001CD40D19|nr:extensin family protein [Bradyrhizobium sp. BRP22]MCA1454338.1 extensin family protein [Bradyrhizobium sp. BRP22]
MLAEPAVAARRSVPFPFADLFAPPRSRPHRAVHRAVVVPLPKPRPAEAPAAKPPEPPAAAEKARPADHGKAAEKAPPTDHGKAADKTPDDKAAETAPPPQPSACRQALTEEIAIAPSVPDIHGPGACGGDDLVRLEAIVLPDKRKVAVKPAAILRCIMATAIADWVRSDIAPLATGLGSSISELDNFDSFECRGRNRVNGAQLSEHGRANAIDVRAFKLTNGRSISLTDRIVPRDLRESVLHSACTRFTTVLGPGSDGYHEDHIHLDRMERRNNYRICQWDVWDPMPAIAPLLPAERPEQAPPREVAAKHDPESDAKTGSKSDGSKSENTKPENAKSENTKPDAGNSDAAQSKRAATKPEPTKKRRHSRRP